MNLYVIAAIGYLVWLGISFGLCQVLPLQKGDVPLVFGVLALLGLIATGLFVWLRLKSGGGPVTTGSAEIDGLVKEADTKLSASQVAQGARISNLPLLVVVGDIGSAKTSSLVNAGLEAELLAGQVYQGPNVVPTSLANLFLARNTVFAEAGGAILGDETKWVGFIKQLRPGTLKSLVGRGGQAPRAAIVCVSCELLAQGPERLQAAARFLQARLHDISKTLGISFPVYVLFTKADKLPFFTEYVRNLSNDEAQQVLGATLPMTTFSVNAAWAEQEAARLNGAFESLFHSLADKRLLFLPREHKAENLPAAYEFPREFRKMRNNAVQFLVDLCRPSQLAASPFLRGFYFTGVRPIVVNEMAPPPQVQRPTAAAAGATQVFNLGQMQAAAATPSIGTRRVPQWMFLGSTFHQVVLQDQAALGASGASVKTSALRRTLLAVAAVLMAGLALGFTVSYFNNKALLDEAEVAAKGIGAAQAVPGGVPSKEALERLDTLRRSLVTLTGYKEHGAPFKYGLGLYAGNDALPALRRIYYDRFGQLLFHETQGNLLSAMRKMKAQGTPQPTDDYSFCYNSLKGYLVTTGEYKRSTKEFLAPLLLDRWSTGKNVDPDRLALAQRQFEFYSVDLARENPYSANGDNPAIEGSRDFLSKFKGAERIYMGLLAEANRAAQPVNFNAAFPDAVPVVANGKDVPGAFTKAGFKTMTDAIRNVDKKFNAEKWVVDLSNIGGQIDFNALKTDLLAKYQSDYIENWRAYLRNTEVRRYAGLKDAATKLNKQSSNTSPLLAALSLAAQNTDVEDAKIKGAFQPVAHVLPPAVKGQFITAPNDQYINGLMSLQGALDAASNTGGGNGDQISRANARTSATNALTLAKTLSNAFRIDDDAKPAAERTAFLLRAPIEFVEPYIKDMAPAQLNGSGQAFCASYNAMAAKFPFNPKAQPEVTLAELSQILRPGDGALWAYYQNNLTQVLKPQGPGVYVADPASPVPLNPQFVRFFNELARLSNALYPNGAKEPRLNYTLQAVPNELVQGVTATIDGKTATLNTPQPFAWPGPGSVKITLKLVGGTEQAAYERQGQWAVFRFFANADKRAGTGPYQIAYEPRQGQDNARQTINGKPLSYQFNVDLAGAPLNLSEMKCVLPALAR